LIWLIWGAWRFLFFDILTQNDISGMGYLVAPLPWCFIASILLFIRKRFPFSAKKQEQS